jgi:hypothetical protein
MIHIRSSLTIHDAPYEISLPTEEFISSLSTKGEISTSPSLPLKYENFVLDKSFIKISAVYSLMEIYWRTTSPLWNLSRRKNNT